MRLSFRKAALGLAAGSLIFYCSYERHRVGELAGESETHAKEHESKSDQPTATTDTSHNSQTSQSPAPRNTPANFFPDKPKP